MIYLYHTHIVLLPSRSIDLAQMPLQEALQQVVLPEQVVALAVPNIAESVAVIVVEVVVVLPVVRIVVMVVEYCGTRWGICCWTGCGSGC